MTYLQSSTEVLKEKNKRLISWRHYLVAACVFLHMFADILTFTSFSQYMVFYIHAMRYPLEMLNATSNDQQVCGKNKTTQEYIHQIEVQEEASTLSIFAVLGLCIPSICSNLIFGTYIDRFGRKILFISALFGAFIRCLVSSLAVYYKLNIYLFIVFNVLEGMTGTWVGCLSAAFAYVADFTPRDKRRSFAIALIEMSLGLGQCIGTLVSGFIIQSLGFLYVYIIATACALVGIFIVICLLPETLVTRKESVNVGVFLNIKNATSFYFDNTQGKRWVYIMCLAIFCLFLMAKIGSDSVYVLYTLNTPFCWMTVTIGVIGSAFSLSQLLIGLSSIKVFQIWFSEPIIALCGCFSGIASMILFGIASSDSLIFTALGVGIFGLVPSPMIRGIMSKMTPSDKQGSMFAGVAAMEAIMNMLASVIANAVYTSTVAIYHGIVYFVLAGFSATAIVLLIFLRIAFKTHPQELFDEETAINKPAETKVPYDSLAQNKDRGIS